MSGAEILGVLLDLDPRGSRAAAAAANGAGDPEPGALEMLARGLIGAPRYFERVIRATPSTLPNLEDTPILGDMPGAQHARARSARGSPGRVRGRPSRMLERTNLVPPRTSFNGRVSAHRRFAFGRLPLDEVKAVKNQYGCTVNDVVVSICAGAVRRWLIEHDELPDTPLVAQIPVSVRTEEQFGTYGNRIGMLIGADLHQHRRPGASGCSMTHEALRSAKERHKALPAQLLQDATQFIPPAVFAQASRVTFSLAATRRPMWNLVISNVPGPQFPLYCVGREDGRPLPGVGDHRRARPQHHRDELLRQPRLRDRRRPRADARRVEADRVAARVARRARNNLDTSASRREYIRP